MTTSEPTTGELIEQLHTFDNVDAVTITIAKAALLFIADRLESQEQTVAALTARAEQAEAREKVLIEELKKAPRCAVCDHQDCKYCTGNDMFTWRGLPQDGEWK